MALKYCKNCEQLIGKLEESFVFQGHVVCKECKHILDKESDYPLSSGQKSLNATSEVLGKKINPIRYFQKHWRGELSLPVSFWVNLFLVNVFLNFFIAWLGHDIFIKNPVILARFFTISCALELLFIYPWQIIGLWRSCKRYIRISGKTFWARAVQVLIILGIVATLGNLNLNWSLYKGNYHLAFIRDEFANYTLKLEKNNTLLHLQGNLGFGVSKEVSKILKNNPGIEGIILDSSGGRIYEGRKLAKLITKYSLNTYSLEGCYSAATISFIAGEKRFLGIGANLAYHQYQNQEGFDSSISLKAEQSKDILFFQQQGVKDEFTKKMFNTPSNDFWYPTIDEMINANVIHGTVNPSDFSPVEYGFNLEYLEEALLNIPVYKTIQKYEPALYTTIKTELNEQIKKGATLIEIQRLGSDFIWPLAFAVLPETSDEALIQFVQALTGCLKKLRGIDPILCMKALYPNQYGTFFIAGYFSKDEAKPLLGALNKIIIDAYEKDNSSVDTEAAEILMGKIVLNLEEKADYLELEGLQNKDDYIGYLSNMYSEIEKQLKRIP